VRLRSLRLSAIHTVSHPRSLGCSELIQSRCCGNPVHQT
jgi:hypothetical protein